MQKIQIGDCTLYNGDSFEILPTLGKSDWCITDPPYGLGKKLGGGNSKWAKAWKELVRNVDWDDAPPTTHEMQAILDCADNHIIWGGNYFSLPPSRMFLIWDKGGSMKGRSFAECEQAWCSFDGNARIHNLGMATHNGQETKQHPTQKPLNVMDWCVSFIKGENQTIIDPYMGSGTTGIAAVKAGHSFIGIERNAGYFKVACERIENFYKQGVLF